MILDCKNEVKFVGVLSPSFLSVIFKLINCDCKENLVHKYDKKSDRFISLTFDRLKKLIDFDHWISLVDRPSTKEITEKDCCQIKKKEAGVIEVTASHQKRKIIKYKGRM